jgi:hypothetical protein
MKNTVLYILMLGFLLAFTACEKEVTNIKLPGVSSKLVVTSFISPQDTLLRVSVVESVPAIGKSTLSSEDIRNATVRMSDGSTSVSLIYNTQARAYVADAAKLPVNPGKTYFLEVTDTKGRKAEASCTVPVTQHIDLEIAIDSAKNRYNNFTEYFMVMKWQDTPVEINYYRVFAELMVDQGTNGYTQPVHFYEHSSDFILYSDNRLDGARFSSPKGFINNHLYRQRYLVSPIIYAHLLNTDEHYYRYHQSLNNNYNVDGNPFAEPVLIYSNMNGGLGVFAAYNRMNTTMPLK